jgi:DNA-binding response OmpR family regulator
MHRILIIEDQADIRRPICWSLEETEFEIHEASNGTVGLEKARGLKPDLILLDVMMPGALDGFQVCAQVKAEPDLKGTPVVLLTARTQARDREAGEKAGADAFLSKPFSPAHLVATVGKLLATAPSGAPR